MGQFDRAGKFLAKYRYDTVFGPEAANRSVFETVGLPLILPAMEVRGV